MRKDRTEAAIAVAKKQFPSAVIEMVGGSAIGLTAVDLLTPPYWLTNRWHFVAAYVAITAAVAVLGTARRLPAAKFRQPSPERLAEIMGERIYHFTRRELIGSMLAEGGEKGEPGQYHLRPTSDFHSMYRVCGYGTYAFGGWPDAEDLFLAAGRPDAVIVIDPRDVPPGGILVRECDGAVLLDKGYTGPAQVILLNEQASTEGVAA